MTEKEQKYYGIVNASNTALISELESRIDTIENKIKTKIVSGSTNTYGNISTGLTSNDKIISVINNEDTLLWFMPYRSGGNQSIRVSELGSVTPKTNTAVNLTIIYI